MTWAHRPHGVRARGKKRALDPSLGQSMSFPSFPQLKLRLEVPLWMDLAEARRPPMDTRLDESDADSGVTGAREHMFAQLFGSSRQSRHVEPATTRDNAA